MAEAHHGGRHRSMMWGTPEPSGPEQPAQTSLTHTGVVFCDAQATFPGEGEAEEWTHALVLKPISAGGENSRELTPEVHCG